MVLQKLWTVVGSILCGSDETYSTDNQRNPIALTTNKLPRAPAEFTAGKSNQSAPLFWANRESGNYNNIASSSLLSLVVVFTAIVISYHIRL